MLKRQDGAAEIVRSVRVQREFIKICILDRIIRVRPTYIIAVAYADERRACECDAAGVEFRLHGIADDKVDLHPLEDAETLGGRKGRIIAPWRMRIAH